MQDGEIVVEVEVRVINNYICIYLFQNVLLRRIGDIHAYVHVYISLLSFPQPTRNRPNEREPMYKRRTDEGRKGQIHNNADIENVGYSHMPPGSLVTLPLPTRDPTKKF